jgi:hypothetical protein
MSETIGPDDVDLDQARQRWEPLAVCDPAASPASGRLGSVRGNRRQALNGGHAPSVPQKFGTARLADLTIEAEKRPFIGRLDIDETGLALARDQITDGNPEHGCYPGEIGTNLSGAVSFPLRDRASGNADATCKLILRQAERPASLADPGCHPLRPDGGIWMRRRSGRRHVIASRIASQVFLATDC